MLTKVQLLAEVQKLLWFDGGDYLNQTTLAQLQDLIGYELDHEEEAGNCKLTKLANGYIKEIEETPNPAKAEPVLSKTYNFRIEYDDDALSIMDGVNCALKRTGYCFVNDEQPHDGFELYRLEKIATGSGENSTGRTT